MVKWPKWLRQLLPVDQNAEYTVSRGFVHRKFGIDGIGTPETTLRKLIDRIERLERERQ